MHIRLIAIDDKMPGWIMQGYAHYAKHLVADYKLELIEIPAEKRTKHADIHHLIEKESDHLLAAIQPDNLVIALDVLGQPWSTEQLAKAMLRWHSESQNVDFLIGGPDGLSAKCLQQAKIKLSLSALTFPHMLVRVIAAEQIYRAWSILHNHPYHR